jgi:trehalose-phosphatase
MGQHMNKIGKKRCKTDSGYTSTATIYEAKNCKGCPLKCLCSNAKGNRRVEVNHNLNRHKQKARELLTCEEGIYHRSKRAIEPESVFGQTKSNKHYNRFRHFNKDKVLMDFAIFAIAFNLGKLHLKGLADKKNKVVINSGRNRQVLDQWFQGVNLDFAAEHGMFYKEEGKWHKNMQEEIEWDGEIIDIIQHTIDKTPRSHLEKKDTSLVWHYRKVDVWLAELRAQQLINALIGPCSRLNLQIVPGNKIVEVKPPDFTKGSEVLRRLEHGEYDFVLAMGDDTTDEDMFRVLPPGGISIKVGNFSPAAKYRLPLQSSVIPFLSNLIK